MGYRSTVAGAITGDKEIIAVLTAKLKLTPLKIQEHWKDCIEFEEDRIKFEFDDIKWYGGYENVDEFEAWFKEIEDMYDNAEHQVSTTEDPMSTLCGKFIRIGEESDDIDEKSFGDEWLDSPSLSRSIEWY
jgi:hypothetical protein